MTWSKSTLVILIAISFPCLNLFNSLIDQVSQRFCCLQTLSFHRLNLMLVDLMHIVLVGLLLTLIYLILLPKAIFCGNIHLISIKLTRILCSHFLKTLERLLRNGLVSPSTWNGFAVYNRKRTLHPIRLVGSVCRLFTHRSSQIRNCPLRAAKSIDDVGLDYVCVVQLRLHRFIILFFFFH